MIELEVYAAGVGQLEKILELDHELEAVPSLRYKVDSNHHIVYLEFEEPTLTVQEVRGIFRKLGLEPRIVADGRDHRGGRHAVSDPDGNTLPSTTNRLRTSCDWQ